MELTCKEAEFLKLTLLKEANINKIQNAYEKLLAAFSYMGKSHNVDGEKQSVESALKAFIVAVKIESIKSSAKTPAIDKVRQLKELGLNQDSIRSELSDTVPVGIHGQFKEEMKTGISIPRFEEIRDYIIERKDTPLYAPFFQDGWADKIFGKLTTFFLTPDSAD